MGEHLTLGSWSDPVYLDHKSGLLNSTFSIIGDSKYKTKHNSLDKDLIWLPFDISSYLLNESRVVVANVRLLIHPLSGLLYCDLCGNKFQLKGRQKYNNLYYICGSNYRRKDACSNKLYLNQKRLEDSVMEEVNGKIMQQGFLESYFQIARKDLNQKAKDAQGQIRRLKSEIKQLEDRMKQMLRDMAETKIPRQMALQVLAEDQSSKEQLEAELKHHQSTSKFRMPDLKLIRQN